MAEKIKNNSNNILCNYGCGKIAKYIIKNGNYICEESPNQCIINRQKNSKGITNAHRQNPNNWKSKECYGITSKDWINKNPKKYLNAKKKRTKTINNKIKQGIIIPSFKNKKHSKKTKERMSKSAKERNNGFVKTKWYKVFNPFINKEVSVQGTWERDYAFYLNNNNIKWTRSSNIHLDYKLFKDDYIHTYYPDFYLFELDTYIEIKGIYWKSKDGRVDDKRKMKAVKKYNKNKKIIILEYEDLKKLNILK